MSSRASTGGLLLALGVAFLLYLPGLSGPFVFDDIPNIVKNPSVLVEQWSAAALWEAAASYGSPDNLWQRPLSLLSFAGNHILAGLSPWWFKLTNLFLHLGNGLLLYALLSLWLRATVQGQDTPNAARWLALLVTAAWLFHPLNLTSVLYVVQRMTALATFFTLGGLCLYAWGRWRVIENRRGGFPILWLGLIGGTGLGGLAKENAVLLPILAFLSEWLLFRFRVAHSWQRRRLVWTFVLLLVLPAVLGLSVLFAELGRFLGGYANRPFTLEERLLTEGRVLWFYIRLLIVPSGSLLSLFHDDFPLSTGWLNPWTTAPAMLALARLLLLALLGRKRQPLMAFGLLFFLAGQSLESTFLPLELVHEHRNYLPGIGILLVLHAGLWSWKARWRGLPLGLLLAGLLLAHGAALTALRASLWANEFEWTLVNVFRHPLSARWHHMAGRLLSNASLQVEDPLAKRQGFARAREHFRIAADLNAYEGAGSRIAGMHLDTLIGRPPAAADLAKLRHLLARGPIAPIVTSSLVGWFGCAHQGRCTLAFDLAEAVIAEVLNSRVYSRTGKAKVLAAAAGYAQASGRTDRAIAYAEAAVGQDPRHLQHRLNLARLYVHVGRLEEAKPLLAVIAERDPHGRYAAERQALEAQIRSVPSPVWP